MKIYSLITPSIVAAISREAHAAGMTVTGHVPNGMTIVEAAEAGMDQIAHLAIRGEAGSEEVTRTIAALKERGTVVDPTQSWNELLGRSAATDIASFQPGFTKIPAPLRRVFASAAVADIDAATARSRLDRGLRIVKALHDAGVSIVAGTDEGIPGHSLHREIELYVEAGLSPIAALQAATIVPARAMKLDARLWHDRTREAGRPRRPRRQPARRYREHPQGPVDNPGWCRVRRRRALEERSIRTVTGRAVVHGSAFKVHRSAPGGLHVTEKNGERCERGNAER